MGGKIFDSHGVILVVGFLFIGKKNLSNKCDVVLLFKRPLELYTSNSCNGLYHFLFCFTKILSKKRHQQYTQRYNTPIWSVHSFEFNGE